ncbi:hypothetical protein [Peribacillus sp. NPDC097895]|uniref:hypothetical protein n=1 Tax=Peribacillus sp. NPDC097895 TaxID=3390619 RepID=UPI003CFCA0EF
MNIKKWAISGTFVLIAILTAIYYVNENYIKEVPLYKQTDFKTVNSQESWESFRGKLNISKRKVKIENFQLILDKKNNIYSVKFDLVDKDPGEYTIYHYRNCFSCASKEDNKIEISKSTVTQWQQYEKLMYADRFFSALDTLNQKDFFDNQEFAYALIVSSGLNEEIDLEGDHYLLENESLHIGPKTVSSGFNLQVIGSERHESFSTDIETTKSVFIDNYLE